MGQKWGKPYAKPCHSMPIMHLCKYAKAGFKARKHGGQRRKPPDTPAQSACGWRGRSRRYSWVSGKLVERCGAKGGALARLFRDGRKVNMGGLCYPYVSGFWDWGLIRFFGNGCLGFRPDGGSLLKGRAQK
ncbi:hypothetical protein EMIT0P228_100208 [Pseudomonas brassicacearum]